jgi:MoxR-like ATPase
MEGVVSWADYIQAIHSQRLILWSTKLIEQPRKKHLVDEILADDISMFAR